jgi:hypothetical protein
MTKKYQYLSSGDPVDKNTDDVCVNGVWIKMLNLSQWEDGELWQTKFNKVRRSVKSNIKKRLTTTPATTVNPDSI